MGKTKKQKSASSSRHNPLEKEILDSEYAKSSTRSKTRKRQEEVEYVDEKISQKILKQVREQQEDLDSDDEPVVKKTTILNDETVEDVNDETLEGVNDEMENFMLETPGSPVHFEVDEQDAKALETFMSADQSVRTTLADIIKDKLTEKKTELQSQFSDTGSISAEHLAVLTPIYKGVGEVLSRYRSGNLPKAFKFLPLLAGWEQILYITHPDRWTAAAVYQATRIFASNLNEKMAQRFYNLILLPRLRDDIDETKMLNFHLYQALRKSLFKPGAFFKGIILPLCESGNCTLREATIIGSAMAKNSIPILHASAAIIKLSDMDYTGANSIFLRILLEKKYALPFRAIDAVVAHFLRFALDKRELPLLWHQCLLTFVQLYKNDISSEQQEALLNLLLAQRHQHVTPEIRKELHSSTCRNVGTESMQTTE